MFGIGASAHADLTHMFKRRTEDRRIRRTRALLQDALVALMIEKGYASITVQEIIDRADVGRATFYAHFADKRMLLASRLEDLREDLLARQRLERAAPPRAGAAARPFSFSRAMLEHAAERLPLWRAIAGEESGAFVLRRIHDMLTELARNDLVAMGHTRATPRRELLTHLVTGAFMATMTAWLDSGAKLSVADVDAVFGEVLSQGIPLRER